MSEVSDGDNIIWRIERLSRIVDERRIVDEITLQVREGEVLAIAGASGAGKSSFLRLLNRLDEPTSGTVYIYGQDYREIPPRQLRRQAGMVMQLPFLFPGTVADNIRFGPQQRGEDVSEEEIESLLRRVELPELAERNVNNLSPGEAQRVSLARTLANAPQVLLLDEPTASLDSATQREVEAPPPPPPPLILSIIEEQQLTCLMVTHDMQQAARMADRMLIVEDGRLKRIGTVEEMLDANSTLQ